VRRGHGEGIEWIGEPDAAHPERSTRRWVVRVAEEDRSAREVTLLARGGQPADLLVPHPPSP